MAPAAPRPSGEDTAIHASTRRPFAPPGLTFSARASVRPSAALCSAAGAAVGRASLRPAARRVARARATNRSPTPLLLSPLLASSSPAKQHARAQRHAPDEKRRGATRPPATRR
jgi:hypothetical protein